MSFASFLIDCLYLFNCIFYDYHLHAHTLAQFAAGEVDTHQTDRLGTLIGSDTAGDWIWEGE